MHCAVFDRGHKIKLCLVESYFHIHVLCYLLLGAERRWAYVAWAGHCQVRMRIHTRPSKVEFVHATLFD